MDRLSEIGSESLRAAFFRDEIPAAMLWLRNEGYARVGPAVLDRYLDIDTEVGSERLDALVESGLLQSDGDAAYELTEAGSVHGERVLEHHFSDLDDRSPAFFCECGCCGALPRSGEGPASQRKRASVRR